MEERDPPPEDGQHVAIKGFMNGTQPQPTTRGTTDMIVVNEDVQSRLTNFFKTHIHKSHHIMFIGLYEVKHNIIPVHQSQILLG